MTAEIDPKLERALHSEATTLNVFAKFKPPGNSKTATASAERLMSRIKERTQRPAKYNFRDLDSVLHVSADPRFIKELIRQPEIVSASMVPELGSAMIEPINPRDVAESDISEPTFPRRRINRT